MPRPVASQAVGAIPRAPQLPIDAVPPAELSQPAVTVDFPQTVLVLDLVELYFEHFHQYIPFLHKAEFKAAVAREQLQRYHPALLFAVISIAARMHFDPFVRASQQDWFMEAKLQYAITEDTPSLPLETIQAAACIIYAGMLNGDYSISWSLMPKAWRQVAGIGINIVDLDGKKRDPRIADFQRESYRKLMWSLYTLDRGFAYPCGWLLAIDDRQLAVNMPVADSLYQDFSPGWHAQSPPAFTRDLDQLVDSLPRDVQSGWLYQNILGATIILGRVVEHAYTLHPNSNSFSQEHIILDRILARFRSQLPRAANELFLSAPQDIMSMIWLNILNKAATVLLYFSYSPESPSQSSSEVQHTDFDGDTFTTSPFPNCVSQSISAVRLIKAGLRINPSTVLNPHLAPALYLFGRILAIEIVEQNDDDLRGELDAILDVFQRFAATYGALGKKYRDGLVADLQRSPAEAKAMRCAGVKGLIARYSAFSLGYTQA